VVHVKVDQTGQRVASVSARNTPEQYEVYYNIEYSVNLAGAEVIPVQRMELTASYSYDSTAVLAKQREQQSMQQALARELAGLVLRRLASLSAAATTANVTPGT
jgi:LPS-assembly lipoprotein